MKLEADTISLKTKFTLKNGYRVDFNIDNSFGELLGFEKNYYWRSQFFKH